MTAVVLIVTKQGLAFVSDLMLTSTAPMEKKFSAPTVHKRKIGRAGKRYIAGLYQKVVFINENVTVGYATSNLYHALDFILFLNRHLSSTTKGFDELQSVLKSFSASYPRKFNELQYIISHCVVDSEGQCQIKIKEKGALMGSIGELTKIYAIGSGTSELMNQVYKVSQSFIEHPPLMTLGSSEHLSSLIGVCTFLVAQSAVSQYFNGSGLAKGWGGGFEISVLSEGKMTKVESFVIQCYKYNKAEGCFERMYFRTLQCYVKNHIAIAYQHDKETGALVAFVRHPMFQGLSKDIMPMSSNLVFTVIQIGETDYLLYTASKGVLDFSVFDDGIKYEIRCDEAQERIHLAEALKTIQNLNMDANY